MDYNTFIYSIKESRENKWFEYSERHHIVPRCIGGSDNEENLIYLTYREHFIAHKLLAEENPENLKLFKAYWMMCNSKTKVATPEDYEEARRRFSDSQRGENNPSYGGLSESHKKRISESSKGRKVSDITRYRVSLSKQGENHPFYSKQLSESHRENLSESHKGHPFYGDKSKLSILQPGRIISDSTRANMSRNHADVSGSNNPMYGKSAVKGRKWINREGIRKYILGAEVEDYLAEGWSLGMK